MSTGIIQPGETASARSVGKTRRSTAHVGNEAQNRAECAPEQRVGHADKIETDRDADAVSHIDQELHEQIARDAVARIVHGARGGADAPLADEPDEPAAQIFALEKHEDDQHQHKRAVPSGPSSGAMMTCTSSNGFALEVSTTWTGTAGGAGAEAKHRRLRLAWLLRDRRVGRREPPGSSFFSSSTVSKTL